MRRINRRDFLETTTSVAAAAPIAQRRTKSQTKPAPPPAAQPSPKTSEPKNPNRRLGIGLIGCGWYGMIDLRAALQLGGLEVLALCDVDSDHLTKSAAAIQQSQAGRAPQTFKNYQDLLQVAGLDAVIIATPPHWHALPFVAACDKGLDVYLEKPVAYDIREGRAMVNAAARAKNIVQVGFQRRNSLALAQAAEYIRAGYPGKIVQVEAAINYQAKPLDTAIQDPPASLDWDLWCGPAPKLPYCPNIGHIAWRLEAAYGNGHLVDWGIHWIDGIRRLLGATVPESVQATGGLYQLKGLISTPDVLTAHFEFEQCPVIWRHRIWGAAEYDPSLSNSVLVYGDKETVMIGDDRWAVIPKGKESQRKLIEAPTPRMDQLHMANFLESVRTRQQPICELLDGFYSTATVQLAMISYHLGAKVRWDNQQEQILDNPKADGLLKREYRAPWKHPADAFA